MRGSFRQQWPGRSSCLSRGATWHESFTRWPMATHSPLFLPHSRSGVDVLVALAVPGMDADAIELAVLRAGHRVAWRASDHDEVLTQLAQRSPEVVLIADHPAVATVTVVGSCDLLGVRSCLVVSADASLSVGAQRLGLHDVVRQDADGSLDLRGLEAHDLTPMSATRERELPTAAEQGPATPSVQPPVSSAFCANPSHADTARRVGR